MTKTQIYFPDDELARLHKLAKRSKKSVAALVREAVRATWLRPRGKGPIALYSGTARSSADHDSIYDERDGQ